MRELPGAGQIVVTTPGALWRVGRHGEPVLLQRGSWPVAWSLPLTGEIALREPGRLAIVDRTGRRRRVAVPGENGRLASLRPTGCS